MRLPVTNRELYFSTLLVLIILLSSIVQSSSAAAPWWQQSINVESKVGTDRSIQSLDIMYPLSHSKSSLTFTDLRGRIDDDQSVEVNLGLAHRTVVSNPLAGLMPGLSTSNEAVLGFYGFADRLESQYDNVFYQATAGFEYFTKDYSLRLNGYYPEDKREKTFISNPVAATGTQIFFEERQNYERPLPGYDVELGRTIRFDWGQVYGRGSYFRFHHSDVAEIEGTRLRTGVQLPGSTLVSDWSDATQLTLGVEWQTDGVRGDQTFGVVRFRMPFGIGIANQQSNIEDSVNGERSTVNSGSTSGDDNSDDSRLQTDDSGLSAWKKDRLTERISRDVDIVTGQSDRTTVNDTDPAVLATTGETLTNAAVAMGGASGKGTLTNPGSLATAVTAAGTDGTVLVVGHLKTEGVRVWDGQTLVDGNRPVIRSADGEHVAALGSPDQDALIEGTASAPILRLDTGTAGQTIRDLTFTGGKNAIRANQVDNLTIDNVTVKNSGGDAIRIDNTNNVTIENSWIEASLDVGTSFNGQIKGTRVNGQFRTGFDFSGTLLSDTVGSLSIGNDATGRVEDVTVTTGNFTIGENAGRGPGNTFVMKGVEVESGSVDVGSTAGADGGSFVIRSSDIGGFLDFDGRFGQSGTGRVESTRIGGQLRTGPDFSGILVSDTVGSLSIGHNASGRVEDVTVTSGNFTIGSDAGAESGDSFVIKNVDILSGDLTIGERAGSLNGRFRMMDVTLNSGDLTIRASAAMENGEFTMDTVTIDKGFLDIGNRAGGANYTYDGGHFEMNHVDVGDSLSIGDYAGYDGSFSMSRVDVGDSLSIGDQAGGHEGSFSMSRVDVGDSLSIGTYAGSTGGSFFMDNIDVGDRVSIGSDAAEVNGYFSIIDLTVDSGSLSVGDFPGEASGFFNLMYSRIQKGVEIGINAGRGGRVRLSGNTIVSGDLHLKKWETGFNPDAGSIDILGNTLLNGSIAVDSSINSIGGSVSCSRNDVPTGETISCL